MKTLLALCLIAGALGAFAEQPKEKAKGQPKEKPIVILEENIKQNGGKWVANTPHVYEGDPVLKNAFRTVHARLETLLVSSGRVNVKSRMSIDKAATESNVYLCSYELVQGRHVSKPGQKKIFILELNMRAWNYKDDTPLPELTRTLRTQNFYDTPEDAIAFITRYLAFATLEAISPVTITEIEEQKTGAVAVAVSAGGELLKKGDKLLVKSGLTGAIGLTVLETEATRSICIIDSRADAKLVKVGANVLFPEPKPAVSQNQCETCGRSGVIVCTTCLGNGNIVTEEKSVCGRCRGAGARYDRTFGQLQCLTCAGKGEVVTKKETPCRTCNRTRRIPCPTCNGVTEVPTPSNDNQQINPTREAPIPRNDNPRSPAQTPARGGGDDDGNDDAQMERLRNELNRLRAEVNTLKNNTAPKETAQQQQIQRQTTDDAQTERLRNELNQIKAEMNILKDSTTQQQQIQRQTTDDAQTERFQNELSRVKAEVNTLNDNTVSSPNSIYLAKLQEISVTVGAHSFLKGDNTWTVNNQSMPNALFAHAPSRIVYDIGGQSMKTLEGSVGIARVNLNSSCKFRIYGNGKLLWESKTITEDPNRKGYSLTENFKVSVASVKELVLEVDDLGDRNSDHSVWIDPVLRGDVQASGRSGVDAKAGDGPFTVTKISPLLGPVGQWVYINGTFGSESIEVYFNDVKVNRVTVYQAGRLGVNVPDMKSGEATVMVKTPDGQATYNGKYTVGVPTGIPTITSLSPVSGPVGQWVYIRGSEFVHGATTVSVGGKLATRAGVYGPESMAFGVPDGLSGDVTVTVKTPNGATESPIKFRIE